MRKCKLCGSAKAAPIVDAHRRVCGDCEQCSMDGCDRGVRIASAGLCARHYEQLRKTGTTWPIGSRVRRSGGKAGARPAAEVAEEAEWLMSCGETLEAAARRLYPESRKPKESLERAIFRARAYARKAAA